MTSCTEAYRGPLGAWGAPPPLPELDEIEALSHSPPRGPRHLQWRAEREAARRRAALEQELGAPPRWPWGWVALELTPRRTLFELRLNVCAPVPDHDEKDSPKPIRCETLRCRAVGRRTALWAWTEPPTGSLPVASGELPSDVTELLTQGVHPPIHRGELRVERTATLRWYGHVEQARDCTISASICPPHPSPRQLRSRHP